MTAQRENQRDPQVTTSDRSGGVTMTPKDGIQPPRGTTQTEQRPKHKPTSRITIANKEGTPPKRTPRTVPYRPEGEKKFKKQKLTAQQENIQKTLTKTNNVQASTKFYRHRLLPLQTQDLPQGIPPPYTTNEVKKTYPPHRSSHNPNINTVVRNNRVQLNQNKN